MVQDKLLKGMLLLIGAGILIHMIRDKFFPAAKQELLVEGHHVDKEPCMSTVNDLFGRGINASGMCDCLIPKFYQLIKDDPTQVKRFEEQGFFKLEGALQDSAVIQFGNCGAQNIGDSTASVALDILKEPFLKKLKDTLQTYPEFRRYNTDSLAACFFRSLNGKVTVKEYFSADFMKVEKIRLAVGDCMSRSK